LSGRHAARNLGLPQMDQNEGGGSREGVHEHQEVGGKGDGSSRLKGTGGSKEGLWPASRWLHRAIGWKAPTAHLGSESPLMSPRGG
jgi:hypothetical protein